ncbi:MAG: phosphotransferase [Candidatus Ancillula trichonymphae]|jgi:hypothetical protein|nr:phosphotransferase [Candidatus Ancillula trichonymphae]
MSKVSDSSVLKMVAVAAGLMPNKQFVNYQEVEDLHKQFLCVLVEDAQREKFLLVAPKDDSSGFAREQFEKEIEITKIVQNEFRRKKSHAHFEVPNVVAHNSRLAVLVPYSGRAFAPSALSTSQVKSLATELAKIHSAQFSVVDENPAILGKVVETNAQTRARLISTLDEVSLLGLIPASLVSRFEDFLNLETAWSYDSTVVHGSIVPRNILFAGESVTYILEWGRIRIGDYALDLAGVVPALTSDNAATFFEVYRKFRLKFGNRSRLGANLEERVEFYCQFESVEKLLDARRAGDEETALKLVQELELLDKKLTLEQELDLIEEEARRVSEQEKQRIDGLVKQDQQFTQKMMRSELISVTSKASHNSGAVSSNKIRRGAK